MGDRAAFLLLSLAALAAGLAAGSPTEGDRALSRDILVRDLASLRGIAPHLAGFIGRVETFVA
ncbi:hypothetical protein MKL09_21285, partial [Methylobacterium sp. J-048]|nr:hypothetical protein [Methylobacterium sp. J-048]